MSDGIVINMMERGLIPDPVVRQGIRALLRRRLGTEDPGTPESRAHKLDLFAASLGQAPIAQEIEAANEQHYEVPAEFFRLVLGPRLKYSCGLWPSGTTTLAEAEEEMLALTCERAELRDGMSVLDLGCGWGALSLWIAEKFPHCRVMAVSNSTGQRRWIESECRRRGFGSVEVVTADMGRFEPGRRFERVISVEMFEHARNWEALLTRIASWLEPGGSLFVHIFAHRDLAYLFEDRGRDDWMARHFFTGGIMPASDLLSRFDHDLSVMGHWRIPGTHYARTLEAWLLLLDAHRTDARAIFRNTYGTAGVSRRLQRWRIFMMACAELFAFEEGRQWGVDHYLLRAV